MRRLLFLSLMLVVFGAALAACSGDDEGSSTEDSVAETTGSTELEIADADVELCALLAAEQEQTRALEAVVPIDVETASLQAMADAAPDDLSAGLQQLADAAAAIDAAELETESAGASPESVDQLGDALAGLDSPDATDRWAAVLTFAVDHCGLEASGLEVAAEAEGDAGATDEVQGVVDAADPALGAAITELNVAEADGEVEEIFVVVEPSIGQPGALQLCDVLSGYLYGELGALRAAISIESTDGAFYASRFNETADCQ